MSFFSTEGWCSKDELIELRTSLRKYNITTDRVSAHPKDRYIHSLTASDIPCVQQIAERALKYVQERTGEKDLCFNDTRGAVTIVTAAHGVECHQSWHRDTPFKSYTACIPLVNVTRHNGCTEILFKSTRAPAAHWRRYLINRKSVVCSAGSIYVFDARLLHRGSMNTTTRNRPILFISITNPVKTFNPAQENWEVTA